MRYFAIMAMRIRFNCIYYYYYVGITVMKLLNWGSDVLKYYYNIVTIQNIYQQHLLNANLDFNVFILF